MTAKGRAEARRAEEDAFSAAFRTAAVEARELKADLHSLRQRGIIIPAGGARMFTCAWVTVRMLRGVLKTRLPIQVWHLGQDEMSPAMAALLAEQDVETVDALAMAGALHASTIGGFELKSFALLNCAFHDVILLDADNVPLIDPEELFDHESFRNTGAVFWPDLVSLSASSRIWQLCGVPYQPMPSFESGQAAIDRVRCFPALSLSWFLNRNSRLVYEHIYGDKDTFLMAWLALGQPFHLVPHHARRLYGCICQHHPDGRRMFQHRNSQKWRLHGFNPLMEGFLEEETCLGFLAELRARWTGRIFTPPPADEEMRRIEQDMIAARTFRLETVSIGSETVELYPHNLMRRQAGKTASWWLSRENGDIALRMGDDHVLNQRLLRHDIHYWRRQAAGADDQDVILMHEPGLSVQQPAGHNTDSIYNIFTDWKKNYQALPDDGHGGA